MSYYFKAIRHHYADFEGRTRRRNYWQFTLVNILLTLLTQGTLALGEADVGGAALYVVMILLGLWILATLIPTLALMVRRLHDIGRSGWWVLVSFVPFVGGLAFLICSFVDSEEGPNEWGEDPKHAERKGYSGAAA